MEPIRSADGGADGWWRDREDSARAAALATASSPARSTASQRPAPAHLRSPVRVSARLEAQASLLAQPCDSLPDRRRTEPFLRCNCSLPHYT